MNIQNKSLTPAVPIIWILVLFVVQVAFGQYKASLPISLSNCKSVTISGKSFTSGTGGAAIMLSNCDSVIIENNRFVLDSGVIGVQISGGSNIIIRHNYFENFRSGVYAVNGSGGIQVTCNQFKNIAGTKPRGQMVQFNTVTGTGNRVSYNTLDHTEGIGYPEDLINIYKSGGTSADPIQVMGNHLRGGGPSTTGGGIIVGDDGGHDILVQGNIVVNPGQYGIAVAAGQNITVKNNTVFGKQQSFTNIGLYVGAASEIASGTVCNGPTITVTGNRVNWKNKSGVENDFYYYSGCAGVVQSGNVGKASIDSTILPDSLTLDPVQCAAVGTSSSSSNGYSSSIIISSSSAHISSSSSNSVSSSARSSSSVVNLSSSSVVISSSSMQAPSSSMALSSSFPRSSAAFSSSSVAIPTVIQTPKKRTSFVRNSGNIFDLLGRSINFCK